MSSDPLVPASGQFGVARPVQHRPDASGTPAPVGVRPWGLRAMRPHAGKGTPLPEMHYCPQRQLAVDATGTPLVNTLRGDPTAHSITNLDGDEGPNEDWHNDFYPGDPTPV